MIALELFSGTHSIGKVLKEQGYEVISLDRDLGAVSKLYDYTSENHIMEDIMEWDYKIYPVGYFDIITASPVCAWWSAMRRCTCSKEKIENDINLYGKPMLDKVIEIIEYFKPPKYWIENPQTGSMKYYMKVKYPQYHNKNIVVDYCSYSDTIGYQKRTIFWTNSKMKPELCKKDLCPNKINGRHRINMACNQYIIKDDKKIFINTKSLREQYKDYQVLKQAKTKNKYDRYKIPSKLIEDLLLGFNI